MSNISSMKESYRSLDIMKFICAILIIAIHTGLFNDINNVLYYFICQILSRIAVPFFFTCSGFLFYQKIIKTRDKKTYYIKYIKRLLFLYFIWSILYIYWNYDFNLISSNLYSAVKAAIWYLWQTLFIGSHFHLWFIPALIFSITILYIATVFDKRKILIIIFSFIYFIGLFGDSYYGFLKDSFIDTYLHIYFRFFGSTYNGLFFGTLFVLLGSTLSGDLSKKNRYLLLSIVFFVLLSIESIILNKYMIPKDYNLYLFLVPFTVSFFKYLISSDKQSTDTSRSLRKMSINIYFLHGIFLIFIPIIFHKMNIQYNSLILFINITSISFLFCWGAEIFLSNKIRMILNTILKNK